jgi:hypothetical protein
MPVLSTLQAFWLCLRPSGDVRDCDGKEGVVHVSAAAGQEGNHVERLYG